MASSCSTCPVCLRELGWDTQGKLGKPENCGHLFCFTCIHEWAKNVNTCPVDRIKFNHIELLSCKNLKLIRKVYVADHSLAQVLADPEDVTYCEMCHECTREDRLLLCDGCDRGYHLECLVPPLDTIPEGDWYCSLCEPIVRSQHTVIFSSGEENSVTIGSEESSEDSDTLQQRQRARWTITSHPVTDSEEDSSESEEDWSQSDFYPRRSYNHNQLSFESSGEDAETMSDMERETGQESNLESGKQPCSDSEDLLAVGSNLRPRFRKSRVLSSESEESGSKSEDSSAVGSNLGPRVRKRCILGTESDEEEGECDLLLQQPAPKRCRSFKDLPNPNVVSLKDEDICIFGYDSPGDKVLSDGTDTPGSAVCLLTKCAKKQTPVSNLLPCSKVGREGEESSKSLKGKEPISSSRQAKKKTPVHVIPSDNDSDTASIHSGYCSPTCKFALTSNKESFDSTFMPLQRLKDTPNSSPHITRQHVPLNRTLGLSNNKSNSDSLSAEGKLLRSAKPSMRNGSFKSLPDDFEEKILGGSISKQAGTKKLSAKGTTKKRTKKRKRGRKCVVSKRNQPSGIKKKRRRRKRRRKFKQRKTPDVDPTYSPETTLNTSSRGNVRTRSHARTAATHSPRDPTFRAAVIEAYRHENTITGLQQAQALLRQRRDSLLNTPLRYSTAAAIFGSSLPTPISGYNTPLGPGSKKQQQDKPFDSSTSSSTPLSRVHRPASGSIDRRNRFADEATRRTIPRRKLSGVSFTLSTAHQQQSSPAPRKTLGDQSVGGGDLLGEICQNLDDLQSKTNIIRRDGSVIPINAESSSPAGTPTREPKSFDHHSSHGRKNARLSPLVKDRDRTHLQQKVHHRSLDCKRTFSPKPRFSQDHPMSWGSVIASNSSTPRQRSSAHCGSDRTHTHKQRSSPFDHEDQHTCSSLHTQSVTASEKENDTLKHKHSRSSLSNGPFAHTLVKQIVKRYYKAKEITDREYKRILEKATMKVEAGHQPINEGRVERLIADYVEGYKRNRTALTS